jgi:hypothetical protein
VKPISLRRYGYFFSRGFSRGKGKIMKKTSLLIILVAACLVTVPLGIATATVNLSDHDTVQNRIASVRFMKT